MSDETTVDVRLDVEVETLASALTVTPDEIRQAAQDQEGDLWDFIVVRR